MVEISTTEVLAEEAGAINGVELSCEGDVRALYRKLNELNRAAICLSGGGIRSASFALGVLQALALHPRPADGGIVPEAGKSLLARFHFLSTVSGGGYIGSWLSAGISRYGFAKIWLDLMARPNSPDIEPQAISWIRENSNYLTPKLGIVSADAWTAVALYLRNLFLNWLVLLPWICITLIGLKLFATFTAWLWRLDVSACPLFVAVAVAGALCLINVLRFRTSCRPTRGNKAARERGQSAFLSHDLIWAIGAGLFFSLGLVSTCAEEWLGGPHKLATDLGTWVGISGQWIGSHTRFATAILGAAGGAVVFALGWITAWPPVRGIRDFLLWTGSGLVYGAIVGFGAHFFLSIRDFREWFLGVDAPSLRVIALIIFGLPWAFLAQLVAEMLFVGLTSYQDGSDADREWLGRAAGWMIAIAIVWPLVFYLVFFGSEVISQLSGKARILLGSMGGISGAITLFLGKSRFSGAKRGDKGPLQLSINMVLAIAAPVFAAVIIIFLSSAIDQILLGQSLLQGSELMTSTLDALPGARFQDTIWLIVGLAILAGIGFVSSYSVNVNRFSLHSLYRNRLIRAFLGATNAQRKANQFTQFDPGDNPRMMDLWPKRDGSARSSNADKSDWQVFHVLNMTLNIVSTKRLAWQERKAESFIATPLHCGSSCKAFRSSADYGDKKGISLGTAMAISGAAASPSMGYHSSAGVTFLLALFNVRLGWWLGNPGNEGVDTYTDDGPRKAALPFLKELFGLTTDDQPYVYLSDGGHFENLGLYEMVRRRCRSILVSDAGCDPMFALEDLGNAVRKISLDLGVEIRFQGLEKLKPRPTDGTDIGADQPYHAVGEIDYPTADEGGLKGTIIYIKAGIHGVESAGVRSYATAHKDFPHETTADQWFSESQFESYRALGFEIVDDIMTRTLQRVGNRTALTLEELFAAMSEITHCNGASVLTQP